MESNYNEQANRFITDNYHDLRQWFEYRGYEFIYLPMLFKDDELKRKVLYYAPYLQSKIVADKNLRSSYLLNFLSSSHLGEAVKPSILFGPERCGDEWLFQACELPLSGVASKDIIQLMDAVSSGTLFVNESCAMSDNVLMNYQPSSEPRSSRSCECDEKRSARKRSFFSKMVDRIQGELFDEDVEEYTPLRDEVAEILENLENNVKKLRLQGVTLSALHEFIDKQEPLSPLVITEDLRIFLPAYNNIEIELSAQRKALYFLFLNHPISNI